MEAIIMLVPPPSSEMAQSLYFSSLHFLSGHLLITCYI